MVGVILPFLSIFMWQISHKIQENSQIKKAFILKLWVCYYNVHNRGKNYDSTLLKECFISLNLF